MILLFSHQLTERQKEDAVEKWHVQSFISLPEDLQKVWSNIDPDQESLADLLLPIGTFLEDVVSVGDIVLIQGDFGACCLMASHAKTLGAIPVYATTYRKVEEYTENEKSIKKSIFEHRRFRRYE
jgi:hypothetical protein